MGRKLYRSAVAGVAAVGFAWMSTVGAYAAVSFGYTLSGNGRMEYDNSTNKLTGID